MSLNSPSRILESSRLTPAAWTWTKTSSSRSSGFGMSANRNARFFAYRPRTNAFMFSLIPGVPRFANGAPSRIDIDDRAARDSSFEDPAADCGHLGEPDHLSRACKLAQVQVPRQPRPGLDANLLGCIDGIDSGKRHVAQDEGQHRGR